MPRLVRQSGWICGLVLAVATIGCNRLPAPGGAQGTKPDAARKHAQTLAINAVQSAATAQAELLAQAGILVTKPGTPGPATAVSVKAPPEPPQPTPATGGNSAAPSPATGSKRAVVVKPRPGMAPIFSERVVSSIPYVSEREAEEDALHQARELIERRLAELDPPVHYRPSLNEVKTEFIRADSRTFVLLRDVDSKEFPEANTLREELAKRYRSDEISRLGYVQYQVEVTAAQVRDLRMRERLGVSMRMIAAVSFAALVGFLFLRADEWTKGYLTRWLAFAAMLLAGGAAAALYFV
jgi:hypothetical protein